MPPKAGEVRPSGTPPPSSSALEARRLPELHQASYMPPPLHAPSPNACTFCGGTIQLGQGSLHLGKAGGVAGLIGGGVGWFFGCLGALALVCTVAALGAFIAAAGVNLKCGSCGAQAQREEVSPALARRVIVRRILLVVGGFALLAASAAFAFVWLTVATTHLRR